MKPQTLERQLIESLQKLENLQRSIITLQNIKIEEQGKLIVSLRKLLEHQEKLMCSHSRLFIALKQVAAEWVLQDCDHACGHNDATPALKREVQEALKKAYEV